jgi:hypothetical protein
MGHKFKPPFEIYHREIDIGDQDGHVCTAESPEIAAALLAILNRPAGSIVDMRDALEAVIGRHYTENKHPAGQDYVSKAAIAKVRAVLKKYFPPEPPSQAGEKGK